MLTRSVLITGSSRGLGLEFVKQLAQAPQPPQQIIATARNPNAAKELHELANYYGNIHILPLDVTSESSQEALAASVGSIVGSSGLNLLINNAGVAPKPVRIQALPWDDMANTLITNTVAPIMMVKNLEPHLAKAASAIKGKELSVSRAAIINLSAALGSISGHGGPVQHNVKGGFYATRASKAALNALTRSLSFDLNRKNILVTSVHPGWVATDLGGPKADLKPHESVSQMLNLLKSLNNAHNGGFYQYNGEELLW